jgi:hypothetical protein
MRLTRVEISGLPPLGDREDDHRFSFDCDPRVNLFIGHNAAGKTTVLRAMNVFSSGFPIVGEDWGLRCSSSGFDGSSQTVLMSVSGDWPRNQGDGRYLPFGYAEPGGAVPDAVPVLYVPSVRTSLAGRNIFREREDHLFRHPEVAAVLRGLRVRSPGGIMNSVVIAALRRRLDEIMPSVVAETLGYSFDDYEGAYIREGEDGEVQVYDPAVSEVTPMDALFDTSTGVFHGQNVELAVEWLRDSLSGSRERDQVALAISLGYSCARSICPEVLAGESSHPHVVNRDEVSHPFVEDGGAIYLGMGVTTSDDTLGDSLYAGALSSGTQGTLLWLYALALRMASHYEWRPGWEKRPGILLIDEVENHLHPVWQRRLLPVLLERFPGLQVFATTHSPFVVAGLSAGQVHMLRRDDRGRVSVSTGDHDIMGWSMDEVLRTFMGVDEPTDQETVDRTERLRELRMKDLLTEEEAAEVASLRRRVNEDFLYRRSSLDAHRERYAERLRRFIESRQSDLSQDGR